MNAAPSIRQEAGHRSGSLRGVRLTRVSEAEWSVLLQRFADASFYQTWSYGAVSWGEGQLSHLVLTDGDETAGIAQVRVVRLPFVRSGVAYVRWGPCVQHRGAPWCVERFRRMLQALVDEYVLRQRLLLRVIPNIFAEDPHASEALASLRSCGFQHDPSIPGYRTLRVDISHDSAVIRKRFDQKWRNQLNGAERNSLTVTEGHGDDLYSQFLALYDEMMARKQFESSVDPGTFRRIQHRLPASEKMLLSVCSKDSIPLSALVCTAVGESGIYLLGATSNEGMKSKSSYLLHWNMILQLQKFGCRWYDLGGINPETNPGVYHFKQGMGGAECRQLGLFYQSGGLLSSASVFAAERLRDRLARIRATLRRPKTAPTATQAQD
jgi:hypothetical protein